MADEINLNLIQVEDIIPVSNSGQNRGLKELLFLVKTEFMNFIKNKAAGKMNELDERSERINFLGNVLQIINLEVNSSGELDISANQDLKDVLLEAKAMGVKLDETQEFYTKDETDALKSNINIAMKGMYTKNDILMQQIIHMLQEGNLAQQFAKDNAKTLHETILALARAAAGR